MKSQLKFLLFPTVLGTIIFSCLATAQQNRVSRTYLDFTLPRDLTDPTIPERDRRSRPHAVEVAVPEPLAHQVTVRLPPGSTYNPRTGRITLGKANDSSAFEELQRRLDWSPAAQTASANVELLFISRQLFETLGTVAGAPRTREIDELRSSLAEQLSARTGRNDSPSSVAELSRQIGRTGLSRARGIVRNSALPTGRLLYSVLRGDASESDFRNVVAALNRDPNVGGDESIELLQVLRERLLRTEAEGQLSFSSGIQHWLRHTQVRYVLNADVTRDGFTIARTHRISTQFEAGQAEDPSAQRRVRLDYEVCNDSFGYNTGAVELANCTVSGGVIAGVGRDIPSMRTPGGLYWSWEISVRHNNGIGGTPNSQEGRASLRIPLGP